MDEATRELVISEVREGIFPALTREAMELAVDENSLLALDWLNGRRTPMPTRASKAPWPG